MRHTHTHIGYVCVILVLSIHFHYKRSTKSCPQVEVQKPDLKPFSPLQFPPINQTPAAELVRLCESASETFGKFMLDKFTQPDTPLPYPANPCDVSTFFPANNVHTETILRHGHHYMYGETWADGLLWLLVLKRLGLQPHNTVAELGFGTLRQSRHIIQYLNPGHYCGVEAGDTPVIDAVQLELAANHLIHKKPTLVVSFNTSHVIRDVCPKADFMIENAVLTHLSRYRPYFYKEVLQTMHTWLAPNATFVTSYIDLDPTTIPNSGSMELLQPHWEFVKTLSQENLFTYTEDAPLTAHMYRRKQQ
eukprot:TRINITY_DN59310_c0_g1_i1.p1 TRINITY_DN59310_c0_g1~~TRINITY_DN59310_c0_g1_i1.p1  ORF type:complete len:317 (+),score=2.86 TRINITY_DN59310_c0_g1_i1:37-951(+)